MHTKATLEKLKRF